MHGKALPVLWSVEVLVYFTFLVLFDIFSFFSFRDGFAYIRMYHLPLTVITLPSI